MTFIASASVPPAAAAASARVKAPPVHEMRAGLEAMTPKTRELIESVGTDALAYQIGKGSVAGALNDAVRFRIDGDGPMSTRDLIPDSPAAHAVMQSRAGEKLLRQLSTAMGSIDGHEHGQELELLVLPPNVDSVIAHEWLGRTGAGEMGGKIRMKTMAGALPDGMFGTKLRPEIQEYRKSLTDNFASGLSAWNQGNMVIFGPEMSRNMLTAAGAYRPQSGDSEYISSATWGAEMVNHVPTHELQHSATPASDDFYRSPGKWLEEATAEVLSMTPDVLARTAAATRVNRHSYAGHMAHPPAVDLGWKPWNPKLPSATKLQESADNVERNYARADDVLRDLLGSAGFTLDTTAATKRTSAFLQDGPVEKLTSRLATQLVSTWKIDPSRTKELAQRIGTVIDDKGGIEQLKTDFGFE